MHRYCLISLLPLTIAACDGSSVDSSQSLDPGSDVESDTNTGTGATVDSS